MCDETTGANIRNEMSTGLTRRGFTAAGAAAAIIANAPFSIAATGALVEKMVTVDTRDGKADAFFVHPGAGRHPGVILWPDALGLREVKKAMARRLAADGYAVLVLNPYYRAARAPLDFDFSLFATAEGRETIMPYMEALTPERVSSDSVALVEFLDAQDAVDRTRGIGVQGYCMGGSFAVRSAAAVPDRVRAVASFHGGGLVTDKLDSPHLLVGLSKAQYLIAIARDDHAKAPGDKSAFQAVAEKVKRIIETEVYAGDHGWCVPDAPTYAPAEADRAWARLKLLYETL